MYLNIRVKYLDDNDADYLCRTLSEMGAKSQIEFGKYFSDVLAKQSGTLEKLLQTASVAFHFDHYEIDLHT